MGFGLRLGLLRITDYGLRLGSVLSSFTEVQHALGNPHIRVRVRVIGAKYFEESYN